MEAPHAGSSDGEPAPMGTAAPVTMQAAAEGRDLFGFALPPSRRRAQTEPGRSFPVAHGAPPNPERFLGPVTDEHLATLEQRGLQVCLRCETAEDVWLVPSHTGADRNEVTFREAATLATLCAVFPGAQVIDLKFDAEERAQK